MPRIFTCLALSTGLALAAQTAQPTFTWSTETDVLPWATGGWYTSLAAGRNQWRWRLVAAEVHQPKAFCPRNWKDGRTQAVALLADRFMRPRFSGPWVGGGIERWDETYASETGNVQARLTSLQATLGAGWVLELGRGFTVNPWCAVHQRIAGDRNSGQGLAACRPQPLQAEASLKIGYTFR